MEVDMNAYDPVLEEIYAVRRKISERYGHNVYRLAEAIAEHQRMAEAKGRRYVRLPIARISPKPAMAYPSIPTDTGVLCACESTTINP